MSQKTITTVMAVSCLVFAGCATTDMARYPAANRGAPHVTPPPAAPRAHAVPDPHQSRPVFDNTGHQVVDNHNHPIEGPGHVDTRPPEDIRHDPNVNRIHFDPGVRVVGVWTPYYRPVGGWYIAWGLEPGFAWNRITSITCEAVNTTSGEVYPSAGYVDDGWGVFDDDRVNMLLGLALDDCNDDPNGAINPATSTRTCAAVTPVACTPTYGSSPH